MAVIMVTILRADCKKILSLEKGIPKSLNDKPDERGINLRKIIYLTKAKNDSKISKHPITSARPTTPVTWWKSFEKNKQTDIRC